MSEFYSGCMAEIKDFSKHKADYEKHLIWALEHAPGNALEGIIKDISISWKEYLTPDFTNKDGVFFPERLVMKGTAVGTRS